MNSRERFLSALAGEAVQPPPVICPGGMMTLATTSAMARTGCGWPRAHSEAAAMADLILATREESGFECLAAPFCMTVEAEALGCRVELGTPEVLPCVLAESVAGAADIEGLPQFNPEKMPRVRTVLEALRRLKAAPGSNPVIGALVGPVTLAATIMEAGIFFRLARREPQTVDRLLARTEEFVLQFALAQRAAGADAVMVAEPSATGEILGAAHFARFAAPALTRLLRSLREGGAPHILHICGDVRPVLEPLRQLNDGLGGGLALSVDAMVSGRMLREELPGVVRIGNVDAILLQRGPVSAIQRSARRAAREFQIVSPACGLVPSTPPEHLRAMTQAVRGEDEPIQE